MAWDEGDTQNNAWDDPYEGPLPEQPRRSLVTQPYTYDMAAIAALKGENK